MTRRQVLDVGDRVTHVLTRAEGVVVAVESIADQLSHCVDWIGVLPRQSYVRTGWNPLQLRRVGGDLQLGDFVMVTGACLSAQCSDDHFSLDGEIGVIVDDYEDGAFMVHCMGEVAGVQARPDQLTRITRAEALA